MVGDDKLMLGARVGAGGNTGVHPYTRKGSTLPFRKNVQTFLIMLSSDGLPRNGNGFDISSDRVLEAGAAINLNICLKGGG